MIFLWGGADALALVGPTADLDYISARPLDLRVARDGDASGHPLGGALADADLRLHPQAGGLAELFRVGDLSIVLVTGRRQATHRQVDAEARIERSGTSLERTGWLG